MAPPSPSDPNPDDGGSTDGTANDGAEKRSGMVQSVSVAARFLRVLANAGEPLALGAIARRAETGASTAHRYMQSLVKEGLAAQDPLSGFYELGPTVLDIGAAALRRMDPVEVAAGHMKQLASRISASAGVAIWTERGPTLVRWYRSAFFSINSVALGDVLPLGNTACGLVFQAFLPPEQIEVAAKLQPDHFGGTPPGEVSLSEIRRTFRAELFSHLLPGVTGQAAPVFDLQGEIACVMTTVSNLGETAPPEDREALFEVARIVARETGTEARYRDPELSS